MTNAERAIAFATECLGWTPYYDIDGDMSGWIYGGIVHGHNIIPPFGEDTPEGWAAHKRWVEPWIAAQGLTWDYAFDSFTLLKMVGVDGDYIPLAQGEGPLPTAAIDACLELVRKEKRMPDVCDFCGDDIDEDMTYQMREVCSICGCSICMGCAFGEVPNLICSDCDEKEKRERKGETHDAE